jgi:hypothetical protein
VTRVQLRQLPQLQANVAGEIPESVGELATNADYTIAVASLRLEDEYRMLAVLSFLNDADVTSFHKNMYLAAAVRRRFLECVARGMKAEDRFLLVTYDKSIYEALCCGEPKVLDELARNNLTTKVDAQLDNPYYIYFGLALRLFAINEPDDAAGQLVDFEQYRAGAMEGYSQLSRGLREKNQKVFTKGLSLALEQRKAQIGQDEDVNVGEQWLSVECLAIARLGRMYGLKPGVKDKLIPEELQGDVKIEFPDPNAILPPIPDTFVELEEESIADDE